jgi:hypothetical protein
MNPFHLILTLFSYNLYPMEIFWWFYPFYFFQKCAILQRHSKFGTRLKLSCSSGSVPEFPGLYLTHHLWYINQKLWICITIYFTSSENFMELFVPFYPIHIIIILSCVYPHFVTIAASFSLVHGFPILYQYFLENWMSLISASLWQNLSLQCCKAHPGTWLDGWGIGRSMDKGNLWDCGQRYFMSRDPGCLFGIRTKPV